MSATTEVECPVCDGNGCEEGCGARGGCEDAYSGPDSHKICRRCRGRGRIEQRVAAGGFVHEVWCEAEHLGWTCQAWKDWNQ